MSVRSGSGSRLRSAPKRWRGAVSLLLSALQLNAALAASLESMQKTLIETAPGDAAFRKWAQDSLVPLGTSAAKSHDRDLQAFDNAIGDAEIVAFSEGVHAAAEPLEFRNRLVEHLVEHKGFTAIAIESGAVEGRVVYDYVRGSPGSLSPVLASGVSWTFDLFPQNEALVTWLRDYNANPSHARKVNFYGFDIAGSPGNPSPNRGPETALSEALKYLASVDTRAASAFHSRLDTYLHRLRVDFSQDGGSDSYESLDRVQRDTITSAIADLIGLLERNEHPYTAATSIDGYQWAYRAAVSARQVDEWLRQMPTGSRPFDAQIKNFGAADNVRDRAQADNLEWIVRREGAGSRILVFAHSIHLSMAPVVARWRRSDSQARRPAQSEIETYQFNVAGSYLRNRFGKRLVTIGNFVGSGSIGCAGYQETLSRAPADSMVAVSGSVGTPRYLLDLRTAPPSVMKWLLRPRQFGQPDEVFNLYEEFDLPVGAAFDVLFYLDSVTPACKEPLKLDAAAEFPRAH